MGRAPGRIGGWRGQEAGAEIENATFEKPYPAKFFYFHLMSTLRENFLIVSLLRRKS